MDIDGEPKSTSSEQSRALAAATLADASGPADPLSSRYKSNSKDAYRERKRQKEIEDARLEKLRKQAEAEKLRKEVEAERLRRAALHPETTTSSTSTAAHDAQAAAVSAERQKKIEDAAERQRVLQEIQEDRIRKFGAEAVANAPQVSSSEQKAAFEGRQKEKSKEEWEQERQGNQRKLAELRKQLAEDKAKRLAAQQASAAARAASSAQPQTSPQTASSASSTSAMPVNPSDSSSIAGAPRRSAEEELAEARRARLGITKITGTQAHSTVPSREGRDEDELTPEQIKARDKARALKAAMASPKSETEPKSDPESSPEPSAPAATAEASPTAPMDTSNMASLRNIQQQRYEEQKKKEQAEAERQARAERAARMLANTSALASTSKTTAAAAADKGHDNSAFFPTSAPTAAPMTSLGDIPLETSSPDIPEEMAIVSIRLPDGRIKRAGFKARDKISAVHRYASAWLPRDTIFQLFVPMPRQEFSEEQMEVTTLKDAGLAPRGTLTVLTLQARGTVRQGPPRPAQLESIMRMMGYEGSEMEAAEEYANLSYEELLELQERLGRVPTGLSDREIRSLPIQTYESTEDGAFCVICQLDIEEEQKIITLPKCGHIFHQNCVGQWLKDNRSCPACRQRVFKGPLSPRDENDDLVNDSSSSDDEE